MLTRKIRTGIISSLALAVIVMTAIALYADLPQMLKALVNFRWEYLPLILGLTLFNYFWRFISGALFFVYAGLGITISVDLFTKSMFILAVSSLVGSASGLPGGLGTADGSMLGFTHLLITPSKAIAGAATLLIRLCTLWFGLGLGVIALVLFRTTQHIDFSTVRVEVSKKQQPGINTTLSKDATQTTLQTASVLTSTGDKFL